MRAISFAAIASRVRGSLLLCAYGEEFLPSDWGLVVATNWRKSDAAKAAVEGMERVRRPVVWWHADKGTCATPAEWRDAAYWAVKEAGAWRRLGSPAMAAAWLRVALRCRWLGSLKAPSADDRALCPDGLSPADW